LYSSEEQRQKRVGQRDTLLTRKILSETDLISQLFGSPWLSSKLQLRDLAVVLDSWFGQYQERDGVAIDRDTETASDGKLYDFQVVPAGTPFRFHAVVENAEDWELGLLMIGLHQFETEQIPLGGGRSRGLGVVKLELDKKWWFDYPTHEPDQLIQYLQNLIQDNKDHYLLTDREYDMYKTTWSESLVEELRKPRDQRFLRDSVSNSTT
jgi:CRISPR/Cas system CSM-associated protein Csm3 (group 7 of RAMP superfamily)